MTVVSTLPEYTLDQIRGQIQSADSWNDPIITFALTAGARAVTTYTSDGQVAASQNIVALSDRQAAMARVAFQLWDDVIASDLQLSTDNNADITFHYTSMSPGRFGITNNYDRAGLSELARSYIWFPNSNGFENDANIVFGDWHYGNYVHEIGHALGLNHPGPYDSSATPPPTYANAVYNKDTVQYTVMSYWTAENYDDAVDYIVGGTYHQPQTPMIHDLVAVQSRYGSDTTTRTGPTVYGFNTNVVMADGNPFDFTTNPDPVLTIWDAGGTDTLDVSGFNGNQAINLAPGSFSSVGNTDDPATGVTRLTSNVAMAIAVDTSNRIEGLNAEFKPNAIVDLIENAVGGTGNDTIKGNQAGNFLQGGDGNDTIEGFDGPDLLDQGAGTGPLYGGNGNDTLIAGPGAETMDGGADHDAVDYSRSPTEIQIDTTVGKVVGGWATGDTLVSIEHIIGSDFDDTIVTGADADTIEGGSGNDKFSAGAGDDTLYGFAGNDTLRGGLGADMIGGGSDYDVATFEHAVTINLQTGAHGGEAAGDYFASIEEFLGSPENDTMTAGNFESERFAGADGVDYLYGGGEADWLQGGKGGDFLNGGGGSDVASYADAPAGITVEMYQDVDTSLGHTEGKVTAGEWGLDTLVSVEGVEGTAFHDYMIGDERANKLYGLGGDDSLQGDQDGGPQGSADTVEGGEGDDTILIGANDWARGGGGRDTATFVGGPIDLDFVGGNYTVAGEGIYPREFETYIGTAGADRVVGAAYGETIDLGAGDDTLKGGAGDDFLYTGPGADVTDGGPGYDTVVFHKAMVADWQSGVLDADIGSDPWANWEAIQGSSGDDRIRTNSWGYAVELRGGAGKDVLATGVTGVIGDKLSGEAGADQLNGGAGDDTMSGGADDDVAIGGLGNDRITGDAGKDYLFGSDFAADGSFAAGNSGDDSLDGGADDDGLWGANGNDTLVGGAGSDGMVGGAGNDSLDGGDVADFLFAADFAADGSFKPGAGNDSLAGGAGKDGVWGADGNDSLDGGGDDDYLEGRGGHDKLTGGAGNDFVLAQAGNDTLGGGTGFDYLYGAAGGDRFVFNKNDSYDSVFDFSAAEGDKLQLGGFGLSRAQLTAIAQDTTFNGLASTVIDFFATTGTIDKLTIFGIAPAQLLQAGMILDANGAPIS